MDSTVKACLLSCLLGLTSAAILRVEPGPDCWYKEKYCDTKDAEYDIFTLTDTAVDDITECYEACNAQKDLVAPEKPCLHFTLKTVRNQKVCQLLREECVDNIVDDCIAKSACFSGPNDCPTYEPSNCPALPALSVDKVRWQCTDINFQTMNPYATDGSPPGTACSQICPSWISADGTIAQLVSKCESGGIWSETVTNDGAELEYPPIAPGAFPKPDADEGTALSCGCQPLNVKWDPDQDVSTDNAFFYDPNAEEAAEFICTTDVDFSLGEYIISTDNSCVLYCDEHYVATAKCVDGDWTGNPEWGFWCYEEPTSL